MSDPIKSDFVAMTRGRAGSAIEPFLERRVCELTRSLYLGRAWIPERTSPLRSEPSREQRCVSAWERRWVWKGERSPRSAR